MEKENLILIHGAMGAGDELVEIGKYLEKDYLIHLYEIPGHGEKSDEISIFTFEKIKLDFENYLNEIGTSYIFGFSLGGYLAISLAQENPNHIKGIVTLGTKFNWNPKEAQKETKALDIDFLKEKVPPFYSYLLNLHGKNIEVLLSETKKFMSALGESPRINAESVKNLTIPMRICRGGKDKMVSRAESEEISSPIKNAVYFEVPQFIHPIGFLKAEKVAKFLKVQLQSLNYNFFQFEDKKIAFQELNSSQKSEYVLVFLHEALGSIAQWKNFPNKLCELANLPGVILEMHGYGFSSSKKDKRDKNYLHDFGLIDIPKILDGIVPNKKYIFIGHSDGGTEALLYGAKYPEKTKGVCTLAAHIENEKETKAGIPPAIKAFEKGKLNSLEFFHGAKTTKVFYDWANTWLSPFFDDWSIENDIKNITTNGLIIQGKDDQYGTDQQVHKIVACFKNGGEFEFIEECGHAPHLEKPNEVLNLISNWTDKITNEKN